ncbi:MAG: hypothetical protein LBE97_00050 [Holosporales bacterium]|jgi:hypothetical protein|nr:hypothetical protein [Holosporales bacterium]
MKKALICAFTLSVIGTVNAAQPFDKMTIEVSNSPIVLATITQQIGDTQIRNDFTASPVSLYGDSISVVVFDQSQATDPSNPLTRRCVLIKKFTSPNPDAKLSILCKGNVHLGINAALGTMAFPDTIVNCETIDCCFNEGALSFRKLATPDGAHSILSLLNKLKIGGVEYCMGNHIVSGARITPYSFQEMTRIAGSVPRALSLSSSGSLVLDRILKANYDLEDGFESDFEKWLRTIERWETGPHEVYYEEFSAVENIRLLADQIIPHGQSSRLIESFMKPVQDLIYGAQSLERGSKKFISIDPIQQAVLALGKIYTQLKEFIPEGSQKIPLQVGFFYLEPNFLENPRFTIQSDEIFAMVPGTGFAIADKRMLVEPYVKRILGAIAIEWKDAQAKFANAGLVLSPYPTQPNHARNAAAAAYGKLTALFTQCEQASKALGYDALKALPIASALPD